MMEKLQPLYMQQVEYDERHQAHVVSEEEVANVIELLLRGEHREKKNLGEDMVLINESINWYWKPRFLVDCRTGEVVEWMNRGCGLETVTTDDIDFGRVDECSYQARRLDFSYPSFIREFMNGVAMVEWQLNPDGRYFMDDDGFGMTDDEEYNIYGFIDRKGKVVVKFRGISSYDELNEMRTEAERIVREREIKR